MMILAFIALSANTVQIIFSISSVKETRILTDYLRSIKDAGSSKGMPAGVSKNNQAKELAGCVLEIINKCGSPSNLSNDEVEAIAGKCNELHELYQDISNVSTSSENLASIMKVRRTHQKILQRRHLILPALPRISLTGHHRGYKSQKK
jgi:hypothetical protein